MTVAHSTLTGSSLHENKGVSSAADNTVATATGGVTVWKKLSTNNFGGSLNVFGEKLFKVEYQAPSGVDGTAGLQANNPTANAWNTRKLNTSVINGITGASLTNNQITLPVGTYWVEAYASAANTIAAKLRLRNITSASTAIVGMNNSFNTLNYQGICTLSGPVTVSSSSKVFELQHYFGTFANGSRPDVVLGLSSGSGEIEIYASILIYQTS